MYLKSRTGASVESVKRARKMKAETIGRHPIMRRNDMENNVLGAEKADFLEQMKNFRPANVNGCRKLRLMNRVFHDQLLSDYL